MTTSEWNPAIVEWRKFVDASNGLLGTRSASPQGLYNCLREYQAALLAADAIRKVKGRPSFWIAHRERFSNTLFDCITANTK